ncbi:hypothetical protein ACIBCR_21905 [Micromonospora echinospora]|uniref:hypothetical protein n=1 Tax=Micromonospora echinospora TaxID=1877 RepID=UPI0037B66277
MTDSTRTTWRRILGGGLVTLLAAGGVLLGTGQPAAAGVFRYVQPTDASFTDSARPTTAFPVTDGSAPIGTWKDADGKHTSRAYFTFDLTPYRGKQIIQATGITGETSVNDCDVPRAVELWRTDTPTTAPTWRDAPTVREKIGDVAPTAPCGVSRLEMLLTPALQRAVDAGLESVTYLARIAGDLEENKHHGRRIRTLGISVQANAAPHAPGKLTVEGRACAPDLWSRTSTPILSAEVTDPDDNSPAVGDPVTAIFAWWPVDRPTERTEWTSSHRLYAPDTFFYTLPGGLMTHGGTYAFAVRASDDHATSDWSAECRFTVDTVRPSTPTVASTDYPAEGFPGHGGPGIPGTFTFGPNSSDDVVGYYWGTASPTTYVAADQTGTATVSHAPERSGPARIYVQTVDRAGHRSPQIQYEFFVRDTAPTVTDGAPDAWLGRPRQFGFAPKMADVVTYTYRLNSGAPQTVAANADGTASVTVTPTVAQNTLHVTSRTRDGLPSGETAYRFTVRTGPFVSSPQWPFDGTTGAPAGTEGTFVFSPAMDGVTEYVYWVDNGTRRTVVAGADGTATVSYTPADAGRRTLQVFSRTGTGVTSQTTVLSFHPASVAPSVASEVYPQNLSGGGPGVPGSFTFRPNAQVSGVTSYVYTFRGEPERSVTANADGTATIEWTPQAYDEQNYGWVELRVRARTASGTTTDAAFYSFRVESHSPTITSEVFGWQGGPVGTTGTFVFTTSLPGATEFVYVFDGGAEQTLAVGADGTATLTWTADSAYVHELTVRARTATGVLSGSNYYSFWIDG